MRIGENEGGREHGLEEKERRSREEEGEEGEENYQTPLPSSAG